MKDNRYEYRRSDTEKKHKEEEKLQLCFVDYHKAFDRVKHDKLTEVMQKAGLPAFEKINHKSLLETACSG